MMSLIIMIFTSFSSWNFMEKANQSTCTIKAIIMIDSYFEIYILFIFEYEVINLFIAFLIYFLSKIFLIEWLWFEIKFIITFMNYRYSNGIFKSHFVSYNFITMLFCFKNIKGYNILSFLLFQKLCIFFSIIFESFIFNFYYDDFLLLFI